MSRELRFEYGFNSVNGIVKSGTIYMKYHLFTINVMFGKCCHLFMLDNSQD
jgi:hypothetical protein